MPAPTAQEMVDLITTAIATTPIGVITVVVDGQTVEYSTDQAIKQLEFWERRAAIAAGTRPIVSRIRLDRAWQ